MRDQPEFDAYVAARLSRLHRLAYLLTSDWPLAEDLVQTALVKAWFAWARIDGNPDGYVRKIIVTTYTSWRRRRWSGEIPTGDLPDRGDGDPSVRCVERDALWRALRQLPARQRAVLVLRYFEDLSQEQTAEVLGLRLGTVKSLSSRALTALRIDTNLTPATDAAAWPVPQPVKGV